MRYRTGTLGILLLISVLLITTVRIDVPGEFEYVILDGTVMYGADLNRSQSIWFPGRSSNWTLEIDIVLTEGALDIVVTITPSTWEDYLSYEDDLFLPFFEQYNVTDIDVLLFLDMQDYRSLSILLRGHAGSATTEVGRIIAQCDTIESVVPTILIPFPFILLILVSIDVSFTYFGNE